MFLYSSGFFNFLPIYDNIQHFYRALSILGSVVTRILVLFFFTTLRGRYYFRITEDEIKAQKL